MTAQRLTTSNVKERNSVPSTFIFLTTAQRLTTSNVKEQIFGICVRKERILLNV
ncbi:hypothetical protein [Nostoc sp. DedSLP04]|uniref:hypothetical protein n=1 Tax=unclassified Nostoc TaxID=2593658 RepID=UPI003A1010A0